MCRNGNDGKSVTHAGPEQPFRCLDKRENKETSNLINVSLWCIMSNDLVSMKDNLLFKVQNFQSLRMANLEGSLATFKPGKVGREVIHTLVV